MKIGVLTGGGDCPGLNAVIRAVVRKSDACDSRVVGIRNGWKGILDLSCIDLDGKMVDIPVYKRAQVILARARAVDETERRKAEARARWAEARA